MKILILAATDEEITPTKNILSSSDGTYSIYNHQLEFLVTGVGMVATAYCLGETFAICKNIDLAINIGVAGSFNREIKLGEIVLVREDSIFEIGAEDENTFINANELGLGKRKEFFFKSQFSTESKSLKKLKQVTGITVNKTHGKQDTIDKIQAELNPDIETMEGAAFFYACNKAQTPAIQIRAISNYIEKRDKTAWELNLAITNLSAKVLKILKDLS